MDTNHVLHILNVVFLLRLLIDAHKTLYCTKKQQQQKKNKRRRGD